MELPEESIPKTDISIELNVIPERIVIDLAAKSNAELFSIAIDTSVYESSRSEAIKLLSEQEELEFIERFIRLLTDSEAPAEVRRATLEAIADNRIDKALPTLQWLYNHIPLEHDTLAWIFVGYDQESLLNARGILGDVTALRDLICYNYLGCRPVHPLAQLIDQLGGLAAAVAVLNSSSGTISGSIEQQLKQLATHDEDAEIRRWAIDRLAAVAESPPVEFYAERLGDKASIVASGASDIWARLSPSSSADLSQIAGNATSDESHRLWAVYTLLRLGITADDLLAQIPNSRIPLPATIPQVLRHAIVRRWAGSGGPREWEVTGTDIRWLIEKQQLTENESYEAATLIGQLRAELQTKGLQTGESIDCGEFHRQGGGTYWLLPIAKDEENIERYLYISQVGPFVSYVIHVITRYEHGQGTAFHLTNLANVDHTGTWQEQTMVCKQVAEGIGFTWVDETMLDIVVPNLCYLYPYESDEIKVHSLLYYWVD